MTGVPAEPQRVVVDAGVLAVALADDGDDGAAARARLRGRELIAPAGIDLEVIAVWHRAVGSGALSERRAALAMDDLRELPLHRVGPERVLPRCWSLLDRLTITDSVYVAVATVIDAPLLTADRNLLAHRDLRCTIERVD